MNAIRLGYRYEELRARMEALVASKNVSSTRDRVSLQMEIDHLKQSCVPSGARARSQGATSNERGAGEVEGIGRLSLDTVLETALQGYKADAERLALTNAELVVELHRRLPGPARQSIRPLRRRTVSEPRICLNVQWTSSD